MNTAKLPDLYVDMDGVLANLDAHFFACFNIKLNRPGQGPLTPDSFWAHVNTRPTFWQDIPPYDGMLTFWRTLVRYHGKPIVLTATGDPEHGTSTGKQAWINHWIPDAQMIVCRGKDKRLYCQPGDILIDDWVEKHREPWERRGGIFIHHQGVYFETLREAHMRLQRAKMAADAVTVHQAYDGTLMCRRHPGSEYGRCIGGPTCPGPAVAWALHGKTAILSALRGDTLP